ncbi:MAG: hypothetical protein IPG18_08930 [Saprospiraceae bacterium]|nr:hypothetical protein [Saprospiraceae bacterium]
MKQLNRKLSEHQFSVDEALKKLSEHKNPWTIGFGKNPKTKNRGQSVPEFSGVLVHVQLAPEFFRSALYTYNSCPEVFRSALYTYN